MEMGEMMLSSNFQKHTNNYPKKTAEFRHEFVAFISFDWPFSYYTILTFPVNWLMFL